MIGACTTAWDRAHAVISLMGNRFVLVRIDSEDEEGREESGLQSILNLGSETQMRQELADAVAGVIAGMDPEHPPQLGPYENLVLVRVANLATKARTAVEVTTAATSKTPTHPKHQPVSRSSWPRSSAVPSPSASTGTARCNWRSAARQIRYRPCGWRSSKTSRTTSRPCRQP